MGSTKWMAAFGFGIFMLAANFSLAQGHGNGHGKDHDKHAAGEDQDDHYYNERDRESAREWYEEHQNNLPPGLAKKDRLPPGLEKQLVRRGTLPPGLQKRLQPVPVELERHLPPPLPECAHVLIAGNIVLLNRRTNVVVDIFHF